MSTRLPILKDYWRSPEDRVGSPALDELHAKESPNGALEDAKEDVSRRDFMGIAGMTLASASAALSGHLEVLKWLRQQGCPWGERRTQTTRARSSLLSF